MTQTILIAALLGLFLCLVYACYLLRQINAMLGRHYIAQVATRDEIKELRLTSRARVSQASYGAAPNESGVKLVRQGRAARSRRTIAGGDESSEQHRVLKDQLGGDNEPDISDV